MRTTRLGLLHLDLIGYILNPGYGFRDFFRKSLRLAVLNITFQGDFAILDRDFNVGCVKGAVLCQALVDVFLNAIVRTFVVTGSPSGKLALIVLAGLPLVRLSEPTLSRPVLTELALIRLPKPALIGPVLPKLTGLALASLIRIFASLIPPSTSHAFRTILSRALIAAA